jgi:hypothetical protein
MVSVERSLARCAVLSGFILMEARARIAASIIGTKKQSDLPEPVPVVTAKLCR